MWQNTTEKVFYTLYLHINLLSGISTVPPQLDDRLNRMTSDFIHIVILWTVWNLFFLTTHAY